MKNAMLLSLGLLLGCSACQSQPAVETSSSPFELEVLAENLDQPWSLAFLPDGALLITQKPGQLVLLNKDQRSAVEGLPETTQTGQGGLLDVQLHPRFKQGQNWVYLSYSQGDSEYATTLGRGRLVREAAQRPRLESWQELFSLPKTSRKGHHFGSRISFDRNGYLYLSIGDRGERERAQDATDAAGSILRLHDDGRIPDDNPFVKVPGAHPAIYSIGHRNPQGLVQHPGTGEIWAHEHGPQGGDELNVIAPGRNFGWPTITYGEEYGTGFSIGEGTHKDGLEQPLHYWKPSIAPSGLAIYTGDAFAEWQGDVLVGALKAQRLVRLRMDGREVIEEIRYLPGGNARIRDVRVGPDGLIYLLTDARNGQLLRLHPMTPS